MPRIAGFDIPDNKKVPYSLCYIYGIGIHRAQEIVQLAQVDADKRARDLTADEINRIAKQLEKFTIGGNLRRMVRDNIERLKRIGSYRGDRHRSNLPVRGQRTRTNARTNRGARRTVGSVSKEIETKKAAV